MIEKFLLDEAFAVFWPSQQDCDEVEYATRVALIESFCTFFSSHDYPSIVAVARGQVSNGVSVPLNYLELGPALPQQVATAIAENPTTALPCLGAALAIVYALVAPPSEEPTVDSGDDDDEDDESDEGGGADDDDDQPLTAVMGRKQRQQQQQQQQQRAPTDGGGRRAGGLAGGGSSSSSRGSVSLKELVPRLFNFGPPIALRQLRANLIGTLVAVRGTVVRVSSVRPYVRSMCFTCAKCDACWRVHFDGGKYRPPARCETPSCRARTFLPDRASARTVDWQRIRLQEDLNRKDPGRVPRTVECELLNDLVDSCVPGDVVTVVGVVRLQPPAGQGGGQGGRRGPPARQEPPALLSLYIDANAVDAHKAATVDSSAAPEPVLSENELLGIRSVACDRDPFRLVVNSIVPSIHGHDLVKAGLALALFGGCRKFVNEPNKLPVRGDVHVLLVGDPGLGKSQMLLAVSQLAPRSVYVCGSYASGAGLTVAVVREPGTGETALEAGALVLADRGLCLIDEFDKLPHEHAALLEAMEQQSVSVAKAGLVATLPARTAVIAAANPHGGHYDRAKTVADNLKMSAALLSRFDLLFLLLDRPDVHRDRLLSEHVMLVHAGAELGAAAPTASGSVRQQRASQQQQQQRLSQQQRQQAAGNADSSGSSSRGSGVLSDVPLVERLRLPLDADDFDGDGGVEPFEPVPAALLRKYIAYARCYVHPRLTAEAAEQLQAFYLQLRVARQQRDQTPITTRQLEGLIRLAEARARIELREYVTEQDALDVIEIMRSALFDSLQGVPAGLDSGTRSRRGQGSNLKSFLQAIRQAAQETGNALFTLHELRRVAEHCGAAAAQFEELVERLNAQGFLVMQGPRTYRFNA